MAIGIANKDDVVADALEKLTGYEWRKRRDGHECRVNHTHAKVIVQDLQLAGVNATAEVSEARSGRYIVLVPTGEGPLVLNAAARMPKGD